MVGVAPSPRPPNGFLIVQCINRLGSSAGITYTIGPVSGFFPFVLNSTTGNFSVTQDLVYATQPDSYSFSVGCYDNLSPNLSSNASVTITVIEVDKYPPVVSPFVYLNVNVTAPVGTVLASTRSDVGALSVYTATDMDIGPQGVLSYSLQYPDPHFSVDGTFGSLILVQHLYLDYAGTPTTFYNPRIQICDPHVCIGFNIYMFVTLQNAHYPMFSQKVYYVAYSDGTPPGQVIPSICTDLDIGVGALHGVVFLNTTPGVFLLKPSTGALTTNITMDYRRARGYTVQLLCSDTGGLTNTSTVYVTITPPPNYDPFVFSSDTYSFNVSRTTPPYYTVGQIMATNEISWSSATLTYSLQNNPYFTIDGLTGTIQTISSVYNYTYSEIAMNVSVTDGMFNGTVSVYMFLTAPNLHSPVFTPGDRMFNISELSPIGMSIAAFQCTDADTGTNAQIGYNITGGNIGGAFRIDPVTGVVQVANLLILPQNIASYPYQLTILCSDHGVPILSNTTLAYFNVYQDSNALPNFTSGYIVASISENANINDTVITINVTDIFQLQFSLINQSVPNAFLIDANTGVVRVATHLSQETVAVYTMTVVATEVRSVGQAKNSSALLTIYVRDANNNAPQCAMSMFTATITDTLPVGSTVLQVSCSDADSRQDAVIVYSLSMNYGVLGINSNTGTIYLSSPLNSTSNRVLLPSLLLSDRGVPSLNNSYPIIIYITVTVHDPPYFTNLPASINLSDGTQVGNIFFTATAVDPNRGSSGLVRYGIAPGLGTSSFQIFPNSGGIFLTQALDYYSTSSYNLNITVSNSVFTAVRTLTINVVNTNQFDPVCLSTVYIANVPENATTQTVLTNLSCSDANKGPNAQLVYHIVAGNDEGTFVVTGNGLLMLAQGLNYADISQYELVINVTDMFPVPRFITVTVYVFVQPVNEFSPVFEQSLYNMTVPENAPIGTSILSVTATDGDGPTSLDGQVTYSLIGLDQPTFSIDRSGLIQLASSLNILLHSNYSFTVLATDGGQPPRSGSASVVISVGYPGNRSPQFTQSLYYTTLNVTSPSGAVGSHVLTVHCTDPALGANAPEQYSLDTSLPSSQYFAVNRSTGVITVAAPPPSSGGTLVFKVNCTGSAPYNLSDTALVGVQLVVKGNITFNPSGSCPFIPPSTYNCSLSESVLPVYTILKVNATSLGGYTITYSLQNYQMTFSIDPSSGYLRLIGTLEYEQAQSYILTIQASLTGPYGTDVAEANVLVYVGNINDEAPVITIPLNVTYVTENTPVSTVVANFTCTDADMGVYGQTQFSIIGGNVGNTFVISPLGQLQVNGSIEYAMTQIYNLVLLCTDSGSPPLSANITVPIIVIPLNDHPPIFNMTAYTFSISESVLPPVLVGQVVAMDGDLPPYNNLWYTILSGNTAPPTFTIGPTSGQLILIRSLDYKVVSSYQLVVQAQDGGGLPNPGYPVLTGNTTVTVQVTPVNHYPQFSQSLYSGTIQLGTNNTGDQVLGVQVTCTDQDHGVDGQTSISITGNVNNLFNITQPGGYVYLQNNLPSSQANPSYILTVTCQDMGSPPLSSSALVIVGVTGGSAFAPIFNQSIYTFTATDSTAVGSTIGAVYATNPNVGIGGKISYALNTTGSAILVDSITGAVLTNQPLTRDVYVYTVMASNILGLSTTTTLILSVVSINNNPPQFLQSLYYASASEHATSGTVVTTLNCTSPEDGAVSNLNKYSFTTSIYPFYIDPQIGLVTVNDKLNASTTSIYRLRVICRDLAGRTSSANLTISVTPYNNYPPVFIGAPYSTSLTEGTPVGTPVYTVHASDADLAPYNVITYFIVSGNNQSLFAIDERSGIVHVNGIITSATYMYVLGIRAENVISANDTSGSQLLYSDTTLSIIVLAVNTYPVLTPLDVKRLFANGSVAPNTVIATFICIDRNGATTYSISPNTSKLAIFPNGMLVATGTITGNLSVEVICADMGSPPLSTATQVTIFTSSNNMYSPMFNSTSLYASVSGDRATAGQIVGCYQATDLDSPATPDGTITYTLDLLYSYDGVNRFGVTLMAGCVFVALALPPSTPYYSYLLTAMDQGSPARSGSAILYINVTFAIQSPHFVNVPYAVSVLENVTMGTSITTVLCADNRPSSIFVYNITGGNSEGAFAINSTLGLIVTTSVGLNYEIKISYTLQVQCTDSVGLSATTLVYVSVLEVNEFTPSFVVPVGVSIPENAAVGTPVVQLNWTDRDAGLDGQVAFSIIAGDDGNAFSITSSGLVFVSGRLDRETKAVYTLEITITDLSPTNPKSSTNNITITVTDVNDNAPTFGQDLYVFLLQGTEKAGYQIGTVTCIDKDIGVNAQVTYSLVSASSNLALFYLAPTNGSLSLAAPISGRSTNDITLVVMCMDMGVPSLSGSATVLVAVNNTNLYAPQFVNQLYAAVISESAPVLTTILNVTATDMDTGLYGMVQYSLMDTINGTFYINGGTGQLLLLGTLNYATASQYLLIAIATDGAPGVPNRKTATANITIQVIPINRFAPCCSLAAYSTNINNKTTGVILILGCYDNDTGVNGMLTYSIISGNVNGVFAIDTSGKLMVPSAVVPSNATQYNLVVQVSDTGLPPRQTQVQVTVLYLFPNLNSPVFGSMQYNVNVLEVAPVGTSVCTVKANDQDSGLEGMVTYSISGTGSFLIDAMSGVIYVAKSLDWLTTRNISFAVIAQDLDPSAPRSSTAGILVTVLNGNVNPPSCAATFINVTISSGSPVNSSITTLSCSDPDGSAFTYQLIGGGGSSSFGINTKNGTLYVAGPLTPSTSSLLTINVTDGVNRPAQVFVNVEVLFINRYPPQFVTSSLNFSVPEIATLLTKIGTVAATDMDSGASSLTYSIQNSPSVPFYIDASSGDVILVSPLNYEVQMSYTFVVKVQDGGNYNGSNRLSSMATITVAVLNINEYAPQFSNGGIYEATVSKNTSKGTNVVNIQCSDADLPPFGNPSISSSGFGGTPFNLTKNGSVVVSQSPLSTGVYIITLTCTDGGNVSTNGTLFIFVADPTTPVFSQPAVYLWTLPENTSTGAVYTQVKAYSSNQSVSNYTIKYGNSNGNFYINTKTGDIILVEQLSYAVQQSYALVVQAVDSSSRQGYALVHVQVIQGPGQVPHPSALLSVEQDWPVGYPFGSLQCSGGTTLSAGGTLSTFSFLNAPESMLFGVDAYGVVRVQAVLDSTPVYATFLTCYNVETPDLTGTGTATIQVSFVNNYAPQFALSSYDAAILENATLLSYVTTVSATDRDVGSYGQVTYSIIAGNPAKFYIDSATGYIGVLTSLDYETLGSYNLTVLAVDGGPAAIFNQRKTATASVIVKVQNINDNAPVPDQPTYVQTISTNYSVLGNPVLTVHCSDSDLGGSIYYSLAPSTQDFVIQSNGSIILARNQTQQNIYSLSAVCTDGGGLSSSALVTVVVNPTGSGYPVFTQQHYSATVAEDKPAFSTVFTVQATSPDSSVGITYALFSGGNGTFDINAVTGDIVLAVPLNAQVQQYYALSVVAVTTGCIQKSSAATVQVMVTGVNKYAPSFGSATYIANVTESYPAPTFVAKVTCTDADINSNITYQISSGSGVPPVFSISPKGVIFTSSSPDYEVQASYVLQVMCSDGGSTPRSATAYVGIQVLPVDEYIPQFTQAVYQFNAAENTPGQALGYVSAEDLDAGAQGQVTYILLDPGNTSVVLVDPTSGNVVVTSSLHYREQSTWNFSIIARDGGGLENYTTLVINVLNGNNDPPVITPSFVAQTIPIGAPYGYPIQTYSCTDPDGGSTNLTITSGNSQQLFVLNRNQLLWAGSQGMFSVLSLILTCTKTTSPGQVAYSYVAISNVIRNTTGFQFTSTDYQVHVLDNTTVGSIVATIAASPGSGIRYGLLTSFINSLPFAVNQTTGNITLTQMLNRQNISFYSFLVNATDSNGNTDVSLVEVTVDAATTNAPIISSPQNISLFRNTQSPIHVAYFTCYDPTSRTSTSAQFAITSGNVNNTFNISSNGIVSLVGSLQTVMQSDITLTITCTANSKSSPSTNLFVHIIGTNVFPPVFDQQSYNFNISEMQTIGYTVGSVSATSKSGALIQYAITGGNGVGTFGMNPLTGSISLLSLLNYAVTTNYTLSVTATDQSVLNSPQSSSVTVYISVIFSYSRNPILSPLGKVIVRVDEYSPPHNVISFKCSDPYGTNVSFALSPQTPLFAIYSNGTVWLQETVTYAMATSYTFNVTCSAGTGVVRAASSTLTIHVIPVNRYAPNVTSAVVSIPEDLRVFQIVTHVQAFDLDGRGYLTYTFSPPSNVFIIDTNTGDVYLAMPLYAIMNYTLTVLVSDNDIAAGPGTARTGTATLVILVTMGSPPQFVPADVLSFEVYVPAGTPSNTQLNVTAVEPHNVKTQNTSIQYVVQNVAGQVLLSLVPVSGSNKLKLINGLLVTTAAITTSDNNATYNLTLSSTYFKETRSLVIIVTTGAPTTPSSPGLPLAVIITIVVMASVLFVVLLLCCISFCCFCIIRHNRNKDVLKNR